MLPTLNLTGDVVLAEHVSTRLGKVGPGDVVVVRSPENPNKYVTKRILGMEGDKVTFSVDPISSDSSKTLVVCILLFFSFPFHELPIWVSVFYVSLFVFVPTS